MNGVVYGFLCAGAICCSDCTCVVVLVARMCIVRVVRLERQHTYIVGANMDIVRPVIIVFSYLEIGKVCGTPVLDGMVAMYGVHSCIAKQRGYVQACTCEQPLPCPHDGLCAVAAPQAHLAHLHC